MARVFLGIGANLDPEANIRRALEAVGKEMKLVGMSKFYKTKPLNRPEQPDFVNGVVEVETELAPTALKEQLRRIEVGLGRDRTGDKNAPRPIDLDLVLYEGLRADPEIARRAFLAVPLSELARDLSVPGTGQSVKALAEHFAHHTMVPMPQFTEELRKVVAASQPPQAKK